MILQKVGLYQMNLFVDMNVNFILRDRPALPSVTPSCLFGTQGDNQENKAQNNDKEADRTVTMSHHLKHVHKVDLGYSNVQ